MDWYTFFIKPYEEYSNYDIALEAVAAIFGLLSVFFSMKKNILVYPTGIISTIIYVYILFVSGLYGDMMINFYYSVMSIYGWILWSKNSEDNIHIKVSKTTNKEWKISGALFILSIIIVGLVYYFKPFLDNRFSFKNVTLGFHSLDWANYLDIITTSIFLVGMWLMAKRKIENWLFWIVGDFICIPMFFYKGLGITAIQFSIFTILAIKGYFDWRKSLENE